MILEGGPYFHNQERLFIKPQHVGFDPKEYLSFKISIWVCLHYLSIEFWCQYILHTIVVIIGKPLDPSHQTLDEKFVTLTQICVEIDLNNPLSYLVDIRLDSMNQIQNIDCQALPFQCHACHKYGHLQRNYPDLGPTSHVSPPAKQHTNLKAKGKAPFQTKIPNSNGFFLVKSKSKEKIPN